MNIWNLEVLMNAWVPILCFYLVMCWGLPMLGMATNKWANEGTPQENRFRYWEGVRFISFTSHVSLVLVGLLIWALESYMFV